MLIPRNHVRRCPASAPPLEWFSHCGEVSEWSKEPASKAGSLAKPGSWVRLPPSPPEFTKSSETRVIRGMKYPDYAAGAPPNCAGKKNVKNFGELHDGSQSL